MFVSNIFQLMNPFPLGKHIFVASPSNVMIYMTMDAPKDGAQVFLKCHDSKNQWPYTILFWILMCLITDLSTLIIFKFHGSKILLQYTTIMHAMAFATGKMDYKESKSLLFKYIFICQYTIHPKCEKNALEVEFLSHKNWFKSIPQISLLEPSWSVLSYKKLIQVN